MVGPFKIMARVLLFPAHWIIFIYYLYFLFILQSVQFGWMVSQVFSNPWDLGSIPRSTQVSILFFLTNSCAALIKGSTICPHASASQVSTTLNPMVKEWRPWYSGVNAYLDDSRKSNMALCLMGQIQQIHLHLGLQTPLVLLFSILFSFSF